MSEDSPDEKWARRLERERRARRQAEQIAERGMRELWLANQTLEEKVRERTSALDRSLAALERASRARQALLADLGHELATPLHAVTGNLELIDIARLPVDGQTRIAQAMTSARQLDGLLQALLAVAKVEGDDVDVTLEDRDPSEYLDELVARWQLPAARRGMLLVGDLIAARGPVRAEWQRIAVAVDAIVDASVHYASSGSLHVAVAVVEDEVRVSVEDSGPALPDSVLASATPSSLTWATAGRRGIGLAIAQHMVVESKMGLAVTPSPLGGVRAVLTVPISAPTPTAG